MNDSKRPVGTLSIDVKMVIDRMMALEVGEVVPYEDLSAIIGRDIRNGASWVLQSAKRSALSQHGITFGVVAKVGVKRLLDTEIVDSGADFIGRTHRASMRAARRLASVQDFKALSNEKKVQYNACASLAGILAHVTKRAQVKRIEAAVDQAQSSLPLQKTLDAFGKSA